MNQELYSKALEVWQAGPQANSDDYHSSTGFLSNSFISDFLQCEYNAMIKFAKVDDIEAGFNEHFAIGHLTEAIIFEGDEGRQKMLERYKDDVFLKRGSGVKAWVTLSEELARRFMRQEKLMRVVNDENSVYHQPIFFKLHGVDFRAEVDCLNIKQLTEIDLKTTKSDFKKDNNENTRKRDITFIDEYNYHRQRAIYQAGIKSIFNAHVLPRIFAISKSNYSIRPFMFRDQERLNYEIANLAPVVDRFKEVVSGEVEPRQCEICTRCVDSEVIDYEIDTSEYCAPWNW